MLVKGLVLRLKKMFLILFCVVLVQGAWAYLGQIPQIQAASVKNGLKKEKGSYYYYVKGVRVKNTWKTVKQKVSGKTVSYRYYFGKDGKAYAAPDLKKSLGKTKNVVLKKIGKYYYGFDRLGHMMKSGYYVDPDKYDKKGNNMTYYFDRKGRYSASKSKAIQKAGNLGTDVSAAIKLLGDPISKKNIDTCSGLPGEDYQLDYANVYVTYHRYLDGSETIYGIFAK